MKAKKYISQNVRLSYAPFYLCNDFAIHKLKLRGVNKSVYVFLANYGLHNYINRQQKFDDDIETRKFIFASCSLRYMAFKLGCSLSSVKRAIKTLRERDIIRKVSQVGKYKAINGRSIYVICAFVDLSLVGYDYMQNTFKDTYNATAELLKVQDEPLDKKVNDNISNKELNNNAKDNIYINNKNAISRVFVLDILSSKKEKSLINEMYQYLISPNNEINLKRLEKLSINTNNLIQIAKAKWIED